MNITNEQLNIFVLCGKAFTTNTPKSKLWFAVDKITKVAHKKLKNVEREKEAKRREFAMTKEKGIYDLDDKGQFQFTPDGLNNLLKAFEEIDQKEVEIPIHIIPAGEYDEKTLTFDVRQAFEGIVIPAIDYEKFNIDEYKE